MVMEIKIEDFNPDSSFTLSSMLSSSFFKSSTPTGDKNAPISL
jgi:hypothetical protein